LPFGLAYFFWALHWHPWYESASRVEWAIFIGFATTGLFLITYLAYLGIRFLKCDETAVRPASITFFVALGYMLFVGLSWALVPVGDLRTQSIVVSFWGIAEGFMVPLIGHITQWLVWSPC
jgi:hypothetical protein